MSAGRGGGRRLGAPLRGEANIHLAMGGVALLLVLLLLSTPFFENGLGGGMFFARGTLRVDFLPHGTGNGTVHLYLLSPGDVRFSSISIGVNESAPAGPLGAPVFRHWHWHNATDAVTLDVEIENVTYFVVNATAIYPQVPSGEYVSTGLIAFQVSFSLQTLTATPLLGSIPDLHAQSWSFSSLPQSLALDEKARGSS